jgi:hypothetical protein
MREISHHHDDKGDDPFNYSHDTCPTCQDLLIVESDVERCNNASSANAVILVALNVSADGMKSKRRKVFEDDLILTRMKDEDIPAWSRARNLLYNFLIRVYCGPLGKGVRMELPDCCLKGV